MRHYMIKQLDKGNIKKHLFLIILIFIVTTAFSQNKNVNKNQLIVKFKSSISLKTTEGRQLFKHKELDKINKDNKATSISLVGNKKQKNTYRITFDAKQDINHIINLYKKLHLFEYVEHDFIGFGGGKQKTLLETIPNDTYFTRQYGLYNGGTFSLSPAIEDADIDMELAWDIEQGDASIIVAILDSGAKLDHPEFNGRIWENPNETVNGIDDDNNGYIDDINGWDFANNDNTPTDDHGHGTNVAGIVGANGNNNLGYSGVDMNCKLMIGKILNNENSGFYSWWTEAIYYAVDNGAKVINMSVGGSGFSSAMQDAINYAYNNGVVVVACMMNENNNTTYYPAGYQNTIAVGATNPNDERASPFFWSASSGSNYGNHIDVVAPGNYIYGLNNESNTNYDYYWGGTSQAAPLVTGLSSLLLSQDPSRSPDAIRTIIRNTAEDQIGNSTEDTAGFDIYYGYGRINAHQALLENTLSISEVDLKNLDVSVSPNPFSNLLTISGKPEIKSIIIYNILGVEIFRKENFSLTNYSKLDLSHIDSGVYLASFLNGSGKIIASKKVIKQ